MKRNAQILLSAALAAMLVFAALLPALRTEAAVSINNSINARAFLLVDAASGGAVISENAGEKLPVAGLSRLGALIMICESFDRGEIAPDEGVFVSRAASEVKGTTAFLREGEQMRAGDLLLAASMINAGDATCALAEHIAGGAETAVERINARLSELCVDANFTDICGDGASLSAMDLAAIGAALIKSPTYREYGSRFYEKISHFGAGETELANPNKLIKQYSGCSGVGTGSSKTALYCGVFAAKRGDTEFIAVVLGAPSAAERFTLGRDLMDKGFSSFRTVRVGTAGEEYGTLRVRGSIKGSVAAVSKSDTALLMPTSNSACTSETELPEYLEAPVKAGDEIGALIIRNAEGEIVAKTPLVADADADRASFIDCVKYVLGIFARRA